MADYQSTLIEKFMQNSGALLGAVHQPLNEPLTKLIEEHKVGEGLDSFLAQTAVGASPDMVAIEDFLKRNPYGNPAQIKVGIKESAGRGWVTVTGSAFGATQKAQDFTSAIIQLLADNLAEREAELEDDIPQAVALLAKLVEAAHTVSGFDKPNLAFSRNFEYEDKTPSLLWVRRHLISLGAYRDDCHMASWQGGDLSGIAWETLTFIWQDNAHTAEELAEALQFRSFTQEDYQAALDELADLDLIALEKDKYQITKEGKHLRQTAEDKTNQFYHMAFNALSEPELEKLNSLLSALAENLTVEEETAAA